MAGKRVTQLSGGNVQAGGICAGGEAMINIRLIRIVGTMQFFDQRTENLRIFLG